MHTATLDNVELPEIRGADLFGGEMVLPFATYLLRVAVPIVAAAVVANWADFKDGLYAGYNAGNR